METLRKGSRGAAVATLQRALGITADGVFGARTEAAVKEFQNRKGLTADGVVGAKTWSALGVGGGVDPAVVFLPLSVHVGKAAGRTIKFLAIHYTAGSTSTAGSARAVKRVFEQRSASADFAVDDKEMVQFNPDPRNYYCWAVGDKRAANVRCPDATNRNTISIEICSTLQRGTSAAVPNHDGWTFTEAALSNAARLAKILMRKYNIPIERVVRHYDITGKYCPGLKHWNFGQLYGTNGKPTGERNDENEWLNFKKRLR